MYTSFFRHLLSYVKSSSQKFHYSTLPQLTPQDVNSILREQEFTLVFNDGPIKAYDSNQLGSNQPIEDTRTEASLIHYKNGFICGIFDGHAGPSCSQVISKRLLRYIAASIVDRKILKDVIEKGGNSQSFLKCHNDQVDFVKEIKTLYETSFSKYIDKLLKQQSFNENKLSDIIEESFLQLDNDLSREAIDYSNNRTLSVAMSGAVACVALVKETDLYVASAGDCFAVMGSINDSGKWQTKSLTTEHNADNISEVKRILSEHPESEKDTIIRYHRLMGQLAPLRAFGDFRYKWSKKILEELVTPYYGKQVIPQYYHTPPYLTCQPEVTHVKLTPNDKFMVIASDGLWDFLTPSQVVSLVGEHMMGKAFLEPLTLSEAEEITLNDLSEKLKDRKAGRKTDLLDRNCATHLIRNALGGTEYGIEHSKLSYFLSIPSDVVRQYRDDITITVIYFNTDYIKNKSKES